MSVSGFGGSPQPKITIVHESQIKIGDRLFNVKMGQHRIDDPLIIEKVRGLLVKSIQPEAIAKDFTKPQISPTDTDKMRITVGREGVTIRKNHGDAEVSKPDIFAKKYEKLENIIQSKIKFEQKIEAALESGKYTKAEIAAAASKVLSEQGVDYLYYVEGKVPPEWGDKTLADLLQLPGNEGIYSGLKKLAGSAGEEKSKKAHKCEEDLRLFLIQCLTRNPKQLKLADSTFTQTMGMGHVDLRNLSATSSTEIESVVKPNHAFTSAQDGGKTGKEIRNHNVNLGAIVHTDSAGKTQCIVTRSGKSDNLERLKEATLDALLNQLATDRPKGISLREDGSVEFRHVITSFMDLSWEKALGTHHNERELAKKMILDLQNWPEEGYKVTIEGKEIILKKPILRQQIFSAPVKGIHPLYDKFSDMGQTESDCINIVSTGYCINEYLKGRPIPQDLKEASKQMDEKLKSLSGTSGSFLDGDLINFDKVDQFLLLENSTIFMSSAYKAYSKAVAELLLGQIKKNDLTALALYSIMFRRALPPGGADAVDMKHFTRGPKPEEKLHPADLEIFSNIVYDNLNISSGKECKSGKDRTAIAVALKTAQARFSEAHSKPFIPDRMAPSEELEFKSYFRKALKELCAETTLESQGYMGFKWGGGGGNPVPLKYLYNMEDVKALKKANDPAFKEGMLPDVIGLTRKDIDALGKSQFRGTIRDRIQVFGKSDKKTVKEVEKKAELTKQKREKVAAELNKNFFEQLCGIKDVLNDSLQLSVHINRLPIGKNNEKNYKKLERQIEIVKKQEKESVSNDEKEELRMMIYALVSIKNIIDEREAIKEMKLPGKEVKVSNIPSDRQKDERIILEEVSDEYE